MSAVDAARLEDLDITSYVKAECDCGHGRTRHAASGTGACNVTVMRPEKPADLPVPIYDDEADPFGSPTNWPEYSTWPLVEGPCGCTAFHDYEPTWEDR